VRTGLGAYPLFPTPAPELLALEFVPSLEVDPVFEPEDEDCLPANCCNPGLVAAVIVESALVESVAVAFVNLLVPTGGSTNPSLCASATTR
jgi:hypothetical protein